jgi:16S rRNA (adenine1518-N6/adenine1519-N6)-dimethyltransferase
VPDTASISAATPPKAKTPAEKRTKKNHVSKSYVPKNGVAPARKPGAGKATVLRSDADFALLKEARRVRASKRFSQNFLVDDQVLSAITRCLELKPGETVLEIGPGLGFLTEKLLEKEVNLHAVELDKRLVEYLGHRFFMNENAKKNLTVHSADFMAFPLESLPVQTFKVVGNLPYNLTSPILFKLVGELDEVAPTQHLQQITVMVQKEVADRMTSQPGGKTWGPLAIALQVRYQVEPEFLVLSRSFEPAPKVTSAVVSLFPRPKPLVALHSPGGFRKLVRAAFSQRRKMLHNALCHGLGLPQATIDAAFEAVGLASTLRAEQLSIEQFAALSNTLFALKT